MTATTSHSGIADRRQATAAGGVGAIHLPVHKLGLDEAINRCLDVLKINLGGMPSDSRNAVRLAGFRTGARSRKDYWSCRTQ